MPESGTWILSSSFSEILFLLEFGFIAISWTEVAANYTLKMTDLSRSANIVRMKLQ